MGRSFLNPMDTDIREKQLCYLSEAKLKGLLPDEYRSGGNASIGLLGLSAGAGRAARALNQTEVITEACKELDRKGLLTFEADPQPNQWMLLRAIARSGTSWPWAGTSDNATIRNVTWWIGESERFRVLGYGHRKHVLNQGEIPNAEPEARATWWPSSGGTYRALMNAIADSVVADLKPIADGLPTSFDDLASGFPFSDNVIRGNWIEPPGLYEILLFVHGMDTPRDPDRQPLVYGSPLWVARVADPVPGTYVIERDVVTDVDAIASWDGCGWSDLRLADHRSVGLLNRGTNPEPPTQLPTSPPAIVDLYSLTIPEPVTEEADSSGTPSASDVLTNTEPRQGWIAKFSGNFRKDSR